MDPFVLKAQFEKKIKGARVRIFGRLWGFFPAKKAAKEDAMQTYWMEICINLISVEVKSPNSLLESEQIHRKT